MLRHVRWIALIAGLIAIPFQCAGQSSKSDSPQAPDKPVHVRISQLVSDRFVLSKVQPIYPTEARRQHIEGSVVMRAEINTSGDVTDLAVLSGDPLLAKAAVTAVKQWKYKPYVLNGKPADVQTQVTVAFRLVPH
jgi:protein TonB